MKPVRVLLALLFLQGTASAAPLTEYRVKPGDSCSSIAKEFYGDAKRIDLIHGANALGPLPHNLVPGSVLRLPPANGSTPDALLSFVWNLVDKFTPDKARGTKDDPLKRGDRVYTEASSSAEVTFQDDSRLQLGETTLVVILGDSSGRVVKGADADDTTLVSGSLRAHLGELVGRKPRTVATAAGRVELEGEAQVHVDKAETTRLSVYSGTSSITAQQKRVKVAAGYGSKAEKGKPPTPPHALPSAPVWINAPPPFLLTTGPAAFTATYGAGPGNAPAHWHIQVASDERFNALKIDTHVDAPVTHLDARELAAGPWFVRVSAIDGDNFEGPFLTAGLVQVATAELTPGAPGTVRVTLAAPGISLSCGLDGDPPTPRSAPFDIPERRARTLRCAPAGASGSTADLSLPQARFSLTARLAASSPEGGTLEVTAVDQSGRAVPGLELLARPQTPLTLGAFHENDGHYVADARWPAGTRQLSADLADPQGSLGTVIVDVPLMAAVASTPTSTPEERPGTPYGTSIRLGFAWVWEPGVSSAPALDLSIAQRVWGTPNLDINVDLDAVNSYFGQGGSDLIGAGAEIDWFPQRSATFGWGLGVQLNYAFALYESAEHRSYGNGGELQGQLLMRWSVSRSYALGLRLHGGGFGAASTGFGGLLGLDFVVIRHGEE